MSNTEETKNTVLELPLSKTRLATSIICIALGLYIYRQADQVDTLGRLAAAFAEVELGSTGMALAIGLLAAGGLGIFTHVKKWAPGILISGLLCFLGAIFSLNIGIFEDLYIWNTVAVIISIVFFVGFFLNKKAKN